MAKPFPVRLEVEELLLGPVLRKLHVIPGVTKVDVGMDGEGGHGGDRQKLEQQVAKLREKPHEAIVKLLAQGPMKGSAIKQALKITDGKLYYAISALQSVVRRNGKGEFYLAEKTPKLIVATKRGPTGRASPGQGNITLAAILSSAGGPIKATQLKNDLGSHGMSVKSASGILQRAKEIGIVRSTAAGYVLTAKGSKLNGATHG
jgi:hypothetical protein